MNSLRYGTYNVANAFVDNARADRVLDEMVTSNVDICVLPEALPADTEITTTRERFDRAGYDFHSINNDDADQRLDARQTGIAVRRGAGIATTPVPIRLDTRNAWYLPHVIPGNDTRVDYFGVHLNDRGNQERATQLVSLLRHASLPKLQPAHDSILMGDINADYEATSYRKFCHFLGAVTKPIPESQPKKLTGNLPTPGRIRSIARRLDEQTDGSTMRQLMDAGLYDADMLRRPTTKRLGFLRLALDRAMVSANVRVLELPDIAPQTVSDHRMVTFLGTVEN